ncbi:hypothetical protein [Cognataquiflexum aquatile]|uniref:hypothetical protein n=1 Tax=Cognataquiflexum aquatile TaxID=2249427 RepID=UPI0013008252|nr:hypothetical protein [Cognataquiflexum aquatile]
MKKLSFFVCSIVIFLLAGCHIFEDKTDQADKIDEGEPVQVENQDLNFSVFEIVTLNLGGQVFTKGQKQGKTLEGEKIDLMIEENSVTFIVPRLKEGSHKVVFTEKNKPYNISFEVKPHDLKMLPATYLESYQKKFQEQIAALEKGKSLFSEEKSTALEKDIKVLKKQFEDQFAKAALLNESELEDMAFFFEANEESIEYLFKPIIGSDASNPDAGQIDNIEATGKIIMVAFPNQASKFVEQIPKFEPIFSVGFKAAASVPEIGNSAGAAVGMGLAIGGLLLDFKELFAEIEARSDLARTIDDAILTGNLRADYLFENDKTRELIVSMKYRTLSRQDQNSSIPFIRDYLASFKSFLVTWENLNSKISLGLEFSPTDPTTLSTFNSKPFKVHSDYLSLSSISNPKVTGELKKENGKLLLIFKTSEEDAQEFEFRLSYENQDFGKLTSEFNAAVFNNGCKVKLELTDYNILTATATGYGPFRFEWSTFLDEIAAKSHKITAPRTGNYSVTVTDQNGCKSQASLNVPCKLKMEVIQTGNNVEIKVLDGLPPFKYFWTGGSNLPEQKNLPNGNYNVTVQDGMGCSVSKTFRIG